MGKNKIKIIVPECLFFGGDLLCGVAELKVESKMKSRGVRLLFAGYEHTYWTTGSGNTRQTHTETRVFLTHRFDFAGTPRHLRNEKEAKTDIIEPGVYRWPFSIVLPPNLPASVSLGTGYIRYILTAYVDIPMAIDLKKSIHIPIAGELYNRAYFTRPTPPFSLNDHKTFLFASGELAMVATIPRQNYFAEETVPINLKVTNGSTKAIDTIKIQLVAHYHFKAHHSSTRATSSPSEWKQTIDHKIEKRSDLGIDIAYKLPDVVPSISDARSPGVEWNVKLVHIEYVLKVRLDIPMAIDLQVDFPIHIMKLSPRYPIYYVPIGAPIAYAPPPVQAPQVFAPPPAGQMFGPPPPSHAPAMPVIENYQYPVDNQAILVQVGDYTLQKEDESLLGTN